MSLRAETIIPEVPEETAQVARAAFPKSNLYLKMRDERSLLKVFPTGKPLKPSDLGLIGNMRPSLELEDAGFDFSIFSEFRQRLLTKGKEAQLLNKMLEGFQDKKLLKSGRKQRTDSTHILAKVKHLSRMESVVETLRAALNEIAEFFPEWLHK
jgi:transposase